MREAGARTGFVRRSCRARRCRRYRPRVQSKPPSPSGVSVGSADALGREHLLVVVPSAAVVGRFSYQTTHGTDVAGAGERDVGLDAIAGGVDVQRRVGAPVRPARRRSAGSRSRRSPGVPLARRRRRDAGQLVVPGPIGLDDEDLIPVPDSVSPARSTHGPGLVGSAAEPPATEGFSASLFVWMFSDGTSGPPPPVPRPWPAKTHLFVRGVESAGEDVVRAEAAAGGVLVPGRPRHGAVRRRRSRSPAPRRPGPDRSLASRGTSGLRSTSPRPSHCPASSILRCKRAAEDLIVRSGGLRLAEDQQYAERRTGKEQNHIR